MGAGLALLIAAAYWLEAGRISPEQDPLSLFAGLVALVAIYPLLWLRKRLGQ